MKKDRNSFFSEYNMNAYNTVQPNMQPNMMPMYPNNQVASQSSFYSGPTMDMNMQQPNYQNTYTSDIESRISKIERQINRIETRLNKIESEFSSNFTTTTETETTYKNNMYMV